MRTLAFAALSACSYQPRAADSDAVSFDVMMIGDGPLMLSVDHVPPAITSGFDATANLTIADATLDTRSGATDPTLDIALPDGTRLFTTPQDGGGPDLVILEVGTLTVTGTLTVRGGRPLVVIARTTIVVSGAIDGSADRDVPGPGGAAPGAGTGTGGAGVDEGVSFDDSGGGGGGFGGAGGAGQASGPCAGGSSGVTYGTSQLVVLEGGSGGGAMSPPCATRPAGAGGGAIQLFAGETITIDGTIRVNGGGGKGGMVCNGLGTGGAGGGSGGAIYIQTQALGGAGALLAQGGGGGGASDFNSAAPGGDGANGLLVIAAATGGAGPGTGIGVENNSGASGGFRDAPPTTLTALSGGNFGNGGGGGGGIGRIAIKASSSAIAVSPTAVIVP